MSGWAVICVLFLASAVKQPEIGALAVLIYVLVDSPAQRCKKLETRIRALECGASGEREK